MSDTNTRLTKLALVPIVALLLTAGMAALLAGILPAGRAHAAPLAFPDLLVGAQIWGTIEGPQQLFELQVSLSNGGAPATDVVLTIAWPDALELEPAQDHGCSEDTVARTLVCRKAAMDNAMVDPGLNVMVRMRAVRAGTFAVTAEAIASQADAAPADNAAQVAVVVPSNEFGAIDGVVRDGSNEGLPGIVVHLQRRLEGAGGSTSWEPAGERETNSYGGYTFNQLEYGAYRVQFVSPTGEYAGEWYNNADAPEDAQTISLSRPGEIALASAWLRRAGEAPQAGTIRGNVQNQVYQPLAGIRVSAMQPAADQRNAGAVPPWTEVYSTTTDGEGNYVLVGLGDGSYFLRFSDPARLYRTEYHVNVTLWQAATAVTVEGNLRQTVDALLAMLPLGGIEGTVVDGQNQPIGDVVVTALHNAAAEPSAAGWQEVMTATTDAWGGYRFYNLPDGYYRVRYDDPAGRYVRQYHHAASTIQAAQILSITRGTVPFLEDEQLGVPLPAGGLKGRLVDADAQPLPGIQVVAYQAESTQRAALGWRPVMTATTGADGDYQLQLLPGVYRLGFLDRAGNYAPIYYGGATALDATADIAVPEGNHRVLATAALAPAPDERSALLYLPVVRR